MDDKPQAYSNLKEFFIRIFDVRHEKENEMETIESIRKGIEFKGTNLWVLIFAVFLASLGLNTNSTAVIIGAMLISPLMGPIMGFGLGLGITDFDMIKRSFRSYAIATLFSIMTSTFYFLISPFNEAQSELLARTSPTVYDVIIAFFGGMAGIIASSTKSKGNVIPGVAIATALMPPLCTAGFGIATGTFSYFIGALYLYFINTVFICVATYVGVRVLKYPRKEFIDKHREKAVRRYVTIIVICTLTPSIYLSYNLFKRTIFEEQARSFINTELDFPNTQILNKTLTDTHDKKEIKIVFIGDIVSDELIAVAKSKMSAYGLNNVNLIIQQGFGNTEEVNIDELKSLLMQDLYSNSEELLRKQSIQIDSLKRNLAQYQMTSNLSQEILPEMKALFPYIESLSCSPTYLLHANNQKADSIMIVYANSKEKISDKEKKKITEWLSARTKEKIIKLIIEK